MNPDTVRSWLMQRPKAEVLRLRTGVNTQEIIVSQGQNWKSVAKSVCAIDPEVVEVYDKEGKLLRAIRSDDDDDDDERQPAKQVTATVKGMTDPETVRFNAFAGHIAEAYRFATEVAFARMVDLFEAVNRRSELLEKSLDATHRLLGKAYQEQLDMALENAEKDQDPAAALVSAFVSGAAQGQVEKAAAKAVAPTNGKAKATS